MIKLLIYKRVLISEQTVLRSRCRVMSIDYSQKAQLIVVHYLFNIFEMDTIYWFENYAGLKI